MTNLAQALHQLTHTNPALQETFNVWRQKIVPFLQINRRLLIVGSFSAAALAYGGLFFWPKQVNFSLSGRNCFFNPLLLPGSTTSQPNPNYQADKITTLSVAGFPLYSHTTCIEPISPLPASGGETVLHLSPFSNPWLKQRVTVSSPELPIATPNIHPSELIAASEPLVFDLDEPDNIHYYQLNANKKSVACAPLGSQLRCNLSRLKLSQSSTYKFTLERLFDSQATGTVFSQSYKTVEPIKITSASIKNKAVIYNKPTEIKLTLDKKIKSFGGVSLSLIEGKARSPVATTQSIDGKTLIIKFDSPLKRQSTFRLDIASVTAVDGGYLTKPYTLHFQTSGGPKVAGVSIGSYGVPRQGAIYLNFDSAPKPKDIGSYISIETSQGAVAANIRAEGKQVIITPHQQLPWCSNFSLKVKDGLVNTHGVTGGSAWQLDSRTVCHDVYSIGSSVNGRSILAYKFGSGSNRIIFVGGTHGDESSSYYTLNSFIDNLEANFSAIPKNKSIIVIPTMNPDGIASGSRTNAKNIDLNRNFPANNWKKDVVMPGGELNKGGGGKAPLSEPESQALASYVVGQNPSLVLTYHAVGSLVIANESGQSSALASQYGNLSGFTMLNNSQIGGVFSHDTTGAFEDWLHDKHGISALLVELSTYSGNEFWSQRAAMWAMID